MSRSVVIVGGGMAGLSAALVLAGHGVRVTLLESASELGGKIRTVVLNGKRIDVGPTVLTMPWVLERLLTVVGRPLDSVATLRPVGLLARHGWQDGSRLDLFRNEERSAAAIESFANSHEADGFRRFRTYARRIYAACEAPFILSDQPGLRALVGRFGVPGLLELRRIDGLRCMWRAIRHFFSDPRLQQLFARYATYYGSDPLRAPATLNLIADVESQGVYTVDGGMIALAEGFTRLLHELGVDIRTSTHVERIEARGGRACAVVTRQGERIEADAVISNADVNALACGKFGQHLRKAVRGTRRRDRSLAALTVAAVTTAEGFALARHNVFFSRDYPAEFADLRAGRLPTEPTVYVCAQDRAEEPGSSDVAPNAEERLFFIINAPPIGDLGPLSPGDRDACIDSAQEVMRRCGLHTAFASARLHISEPADFEHAFAATGGALYGAATHHWHSALTRPGATTRIPGLYVASGSAHPGAGVPMASLGGQQAAARVLADLRMTCRLPRVGMLGGTSTR